MLKRERYLKQIRPFYHDDLIKVITGIRRSGKSFLLLQIIDELKSLGIKDEQIILIDLDSKPYFNLRTKDELTKVIDELLITNEPSYLFIDEIQNIKDFEEVINSYRTSYNTSIFITGSNTYLLSGELITKLTGRYLEFQIFPFSYKESLDYLKSINQDINFDLQNYISYGGLPKRFDYKDSTDIIKYISSVSNQIIDKDILSQVDIRNQDLLKRLIKYVSNNPASTFSSESIYKYLKSEKINTKINTINRYLNFILNSKIINKCSRYDIKGKSTLKYEEKYYLSDLSFKSLVQNTNTISYSHALENIVYNEFKSKGYSIYIGKLYQKEIDFIVEKGNKRAYIQVTYLMVDDKTYQREFEPLLMIKDNYPKFVISLDPLDLSTKGIIHLNLIDDFLLKEEFVL